jgi:hypothetical protein
MPRLLFVLLTLLPSSALASDCQLFYATRSQLQNVRTSQEDIRSLSRALNDALKTSFEFLNKVDKATLGLASAILLGVPSLESIKPTEWSKVQVTGSLLFQDAPFSIVPIRGAKMIFEADGNKQELVTGTKGEFAGHFYELVPYKRLRLFPAVIFETGNKLQPTLKVPIKVTVESKTCSGSFTVDHVPLEPVSVIAVNKPVEKP